jgi:hypothetical protein
MQLVLSNAQSELSPLEIGVHALEAIENGVGGRGKKGGLSAYAEKIGKSQDAVSLYRKAAEVATNLRDISEVSALLDKTYHLAAIHKAYAPLWQLLVGTMLEKKGARFTPSQQATGPYANCDSFIILAVCISHGFSSPGAGVRWVVVSRSAETFPQARLSRLLIPHVKFSG